MGDGDCVETNREESNDLHTQHTRDMETPTGLLYALLEQQQEMMDSLRDSVKRGREMEDFPVSSARIKPSGLTCFEQGT